MDGGDILHELHSLVWRVGAMFTGPPLNLCFFDQPTNVDSGMVNEQNFQVPFNTPLERPSTGLLFDSTCRCMVKHSVY